MAFVRKRETKTGAISTALVEAYRDDQGRPRQRVLANLYGEGSTLDALARLAAHRHGLRQERKQIQPDLKDAEQFHSGWVIAMGDGRSFSPQERRDIDQLLRERKCLLKRVKVIDNQLARIARDGAIIKKHCDASPDEIQTAIKAFQKKLEVAEMLMLGAEFDLLRAKSRLRQLSAIEPATSAETEVRQLSKVLGI